MKILYHHRTQGKGVEGLHIREVVKGFITLGHQVDIVSPPGITVKATENPSGSVRFAGLLKQGSKRLPEVIFEIMEIGYNLKAIRSINAELIKNHFDLIFERYAIFNWSGTICAKKKGVPIIMEVNYTSYTPLARKRSYILKPLAHKIDRWLFQSVDGFVVVSIWLKKHLMDLGVDEDRIVVLTNAVDPVIFSPAISGKDVREVLGLEGNIVVGYVGGFYEWHGIDFLMEVFRELVADCKDVKLLLVGDGPMRKTLERCALKLGIEKKVCFASTVPHDLLPQYISAFDIGVLPDTNEYCSPMKVFEYMAMGKPVVAPDLGNLRESFTNGEQGFLFEHRNARSLLISLKVLIEDRKLRDNIGVKGREHILKEHTWQNNCLKILELYSRVIY